jgi:hypothetical protein
MTIQGGSAAAPSLTFSGDTNTGIFSPAADTIAFSEGGVESMRIDASGNVGVGTTTPTNYGKLAVSGDIGAFVPTAGVLNGTRSIYIGPGSEYTSASAPYVRATVTNSSTLATALSFGVYSGSAQNEAMRIDASGNLLVGTTSSPSFTGSRLRVQGGIETQGFNQYNIAATTSGSDFEWVLRTGARQLFYVNNATIVASLSTTGVWTNASDARYKENITDSGYGLDAVMALKPRTYNLIDQTDKPQIGFIAQEVLDVVPEVVDSTYNSITEEDRYTLSYGQLTAVLTKAIQELKAELDATKAEVALLKGAA